MITPRSASAVLDRDYLETRTRILDIAAALDRYDAAPDQPAQVDARRAQIDRALKALLQSGHDRAEVIQRIFSLDYDPNWQQGNGSAGTRA